MTTPDETSSHIPTPVPDGATLPEGTSESVGPVSSPRTSNEVLLGGMVVAVLSLLLLVLAGTFGYFGYGLWKAAQVERTTPSIQELGEKPLSPEQIAAAPTPTPPPTPITPPPASVPTPTSETQLVALEVKVLNGGGARGSASTLTELLKKVGYTKAAFGNAVNDHTGTVVYYTAALQGEAEAVKAVVAKTYPNTTLTPAQSGDKDATVAGIVVILGK